MLLSQAQVKSIRKMQGQNVALSWEKADATHLQSDDCVRHACSMKVPSQFDKITINMTKRAQRFIREAISAPFFVNLSRMEFQQD